MRNFYSSSFYYKVLLTGIISVLAGSVNAQIKIGNNGTNISPASLLELESTDRGLLIPRMANTTAIDALNPPEGMLIYRTTAPAGLYVRKATQWEYLTGFASGNAFFNNVTVSGAVTAGSFSGPLTGNASTATLAANATNSDNSAITDNIPNPGVTYPLFVNSTPGFQALQSNSSNLTYRPATGILTARGFAGPLTGDVTGNATSAVDAQNTVNLRITDDLVTPTTMYPTFVGGTTGPLAARVSSTRLSFIPLTGELTAPTFRGNLLGNATSATTVTGVVNAPNGGTGQTIYTPGDILYADASNTLAKLPIGVQGTILRVDASNRPSWSTAGGGTVTNVTGVANRISVVDPTVEPIVDIDVNYAGQASINTLGTVTTGTWNGTPVGAAYGGTGRATLSAGAILVGNGTGNVTEVTGPANLVLTSRGPGLAPEYRAPGIGDMVLGADQIVTFPKRFEDGTLVIRGTGTGETTLNADVNSVGVATFPAGSYTLVGTTGIQTISGKTFANNTRFLGTTILDIINNTSQLTTGNITAGSFTGPLTGNVTGNVSGSAGTAATFTTPLVGEVTAGNNGTNTQVSTLGIYPRATFLGLFANVAAATENNTIDAIVQRNAQGDFAAGTITATSFSGPLSGNATSATTAVSATNSTNATNTVITNENTLSAVHYPTFVSATTGNLPQRVGSPFLTYVPNTGLLSAGSVTAVTFTSTEPTLAPFTVASTAPVTNLSIGGSAPAGFLTGGTLAAGVTASSLTSLGTIAALRATTINDVTITDPGTSATLSLANGSTLATSGNFSTTLTATNTTTLTLPTTGTLATLAGTEPLTNKTINGNTITNGAGTLNLGGSTLAITSGSVTLNSAGPSSVTLPATGVLIAGLSGTGNLNFNSTNDGAEETLTINVATAAEGDPVSLGVPSALMVAGVSFTAWVSGAGVVSVRFRNNSGGAIDPNPGDFNVKVFK
jgi:hypothetical protein